MGSMEWKGEEIKTIGDLAKAMCKANDKKEAAEFKEKYRKAVDKPEYAERNIGYVSGYLSLEKGREIRQLFEVEHPVLDLD